MFRPIPLSDLLGLWFRTGFALWETQTAIAMRVMGLPGACPETTLENRSSVRARTAPFRTARRAQQPDKAPSEQTVRRNTRTAKRRPANGAAKPG
jgi:hypothetical protein